jgi:hypothetical protein
MVMMTLPDMKLELLRRGVDSSLRGTGAAEFLYAEHQGRAVEISEHQDRWWIEFWEASEDERAPPVSERFFLSAVEVVRAASDWLLAK